MMIGQSSGWEVAISLGGRNCPRTRRLFTKLSVIASPDIASSNKYSRYLKLGCCLTCISPFFVLFFLYLFFLNLEAKSIDFALTSPSYAFSLLFAN